jgi:uncharacterized protein involved in exopolysaccharide biosynthesis
MNMDAHSQPVVSSDSGPASDEVQINLRNVATRVFRGYKTILTLAFAGLALSLVLALLLPKTYLAEAVFQPPATPDTSPASALLVRQDPSDLYLGLLGSRSVADSVIDQVHLKDVYHVNYYVDARARLGKQVKFDVSKNTLISISVETTDPQLSTNIANAYLDALYKLKGSMSASASAHRSQFFREQLDAEREQLAQAEADMQTVQEKTGLILPESEAAAGLSNTARLQSTLQDAQTRLSALLVSSTDQNPEVVQLRTQIASIQEQIRRQQTSATGSPATGIPSGARLPGLMLDYVRKQRELKERETLYDSLVQQYEKARLASLDPGPQLEVVDRAIHPERKSGPPRTLIVLVGTALGALTGLLWVLFSGSIRRTKRGNLAVDPQVHAR